MALILKPAVAPQSCLTEFVENFRAAHVPAGDDEALIGQAGLLAGLYDNRDFLVRELMSRLEAMWDKDYRATATSQTVNLGDLGNGHYLRMVFWPSRADEFFERCDNSVFYYGRPHDHNFSFLTLGYDGPGYESDYFQINEPTDKWYPGRQVTLTPTGRDRLKPGQVMCYRRHIDVHSQLPPSENSISVNIMGVATRGSGANQFIFDENCGSVQQVMQNRFNPIIFDMAAAFDSGQTEEFASTIAAQTDDEYVKFYAERFLLKQSLKRSEDISLASKNNGSWKSSYLTKTRI